MSMNANPQVQPQAAGKSWLITALLSFFVGFLGIHRFYTGYIGIGIAQLLTFGGCGLWALIDLICILANKFNDAKGKTLTDYNKVVAIVLGALLVLSIIVGMLSNLLSVAALFAGQS